MALGALYIQQGGTCQGSCPFGVLFLAPNLIVLQVALHGPRGLDDFFIGLIRWRAVMRRPLVAAVADRALGGAQSDSRGSLSS